jgi:hexosaminidase
LIDQDPAVNSTEELPTYFFRRISQILADRGLKAAGWEEIAMQKVADGGWVPHPDFANGNVIPFVWQNLWGNQDLGYRLANAGYPVVLCNVTNLYFDLAYNKDPQEPGFYWGGFVDTRKAFDFRPFDMFTSTNVDPMGNAFDVEKDYQNMERLQPAARKNILGIQGQLWSETIKGQNMMEYYIFPKLLALAERAWGHPLPDGAAARTDWEEFANALGQRELTHLNYLSGGYNFRIPTPGAKVENGQAMANVVFPGLTIRYTTDGSEPNADSPVYTAPVAVDSLICFKTFDHRGRAGRMVCVSQ